MSHNLYVISSSAQGTQCPTPVGTCAELTGIFRAAPMICSKEECGELLPIWHALVKLTRIYT